MSKKTFWNVIKYVLAFVLLAWVILLNWDPRKHSWTSLGDIVSDTLQGDPGRTIRDAARFRLTPEALAELEHANPDADLARLQPLVGEGFDSPTAFQNRVEELLQNGDDTSQLRAQVTKASEKLGLAYVLKKHFIEGSPIQWHFFALAWVICLLATLLTFVRWYFLVRAVGLPFTVPDALRLGMVGYFFNTFLPGSVGGDIVKAAFLAREHKRRTVAVATVLMDRVLALWAFIGFVAIAGTVFWLTGNLSGPGMEASLWMTWLSAAAVVSSLVVWLLLGLLPQWRVDKFAWRLENQVPKIGPSLAEFWRAVWMYRQRQKTVALTTVMTWVAEFGFIMVFYFSVRTLWSEAEYGPIPSFAQHMLLVPIGLVVMAIPIFPGGVGIGELGFGGLYTAMGCVAAIAVLGSLVQRVIMWSLGLLGLAVYQRMKPALKQAVQEQAATTEVTPAPPREATKV